MDTAASSGDGDVLKVLLLKYVREGGRGVEGRIKNWKGDWTHGVIAAVGEIFQGENKGGLTGYDKLGEKEDEVDRIMGVVKKIGAEGSRRIRGMRETLRAAREYIKAGNEIRRRGRGESIVEGMEDEPGKVWEALEEVIGKVGGGYGAEDGGGGVGFIEAVGLVAVTVAGSMMVGNVKVGEVEVRRLLKATLECCVRFEGGVEDEGVKESVGVLARGLSEGEGEEEEEKEVAFRAVWKWMGEEEALDFSVKWKYWRGVCEVCREKGGSNDASGRELLRAMWKENEDEEFRAFVLGYFKGEGDFSWVLDVGRGSKSLKEWCVLNNTYKWVADSREKDWSGVMESSLEEAVRSKGKKDRLRLLSIAKLAAKAGGIDEKEIGDMISVSHAQNMMEGGEDGEALGTKEVCDAARGRIKAGEDVVKHFMIAMACARALGGDRAEDATVEIWRDVLGVDGGSVWGRAENAGGEEERDAVIRGGDFY
ncbi:hypothetical protein TrRE_jg12642, partial [Triparma retinervis]